MIKAFNKEYEFLSNFYPCKIKILSRVFPSAEHAYQACKWNDPEWIKACENPELPPGLIKKESQKIPLRKDWDKVKLGFMEKILRVKFSDPELMRKLRLTGNQELQEGNWWGDTFWGVDFYRGGENHLGKLLMKIRDMNELSEAQKQRICDYLVESLKKARMKYDENHLVDILSSGETIKEGIEEIENIVEQIYFDMDTWEI